MQKLRNTLALVMCRGDTQPSKDVEYFTIIGRGIFPDSNPAVQTTTTASSPP